MSKCFEPGKIKDMTLPNRLVRSATWEGMAADDGAVTPKLLETYTALAEGGVGLIISSHAYVVEPGQAGPGQLGVYKDELIPGLKELTSAVHDKGGKIVMQLAHAGNFAAEALTGSPPWAASVFDGLSKSPRYEMTMDDIHSLTSLFAEAAARAQSAGFDGVQLHAAHGYLLSQFLSPLFNKRRDEYGGEIENRARFLMETYGAVRTAVGDDYPVMAKLNCGDFEDGGLELSEAVSVGRRLADAGLDALEISGGLLTSKFLSPSRMVKKKEQEAYFKSEAAAFRRELSIPLILVGGIRSLETVESLLADNIVDFLSMARPLIREPGLVNRWKSGDRRKAFCVSDNACFRSAKDGLGVYCLTAKEEKS